MDLKSFFSSAKAQADTISALEAKVSKLENDHSALIAEYETSKKALVEANSTIDEFKKSVAEYQETIKEQEAIEKSAAVKAVQFVASVGISPVKVSVSDESDHSTKSSKELQDELASIKDLNERQAFFQKHKAAFYKN